MPTAIDTSQKSSKRAPEALGVSAMGDGDFDRAASLFARAIEIDGPRSEHCGNLAAALLNAGKFRQAAVCYEQAIAGDPGNIRFYLDLARALIQDGRASEAVSHLKRALTLMPESAEGWALLGGAMNLTGQTALAAEALQQAVEIDPGQASYHFDLGLVLCQLGDLEGSEAAYRRALLVNPEFPQALNNLGNLLRRSHAPVEAVACFRRVLQNKPDYADARYNLGLALQSLDRLEDAEACYQRVMKEVPGHHAASNNCANVLMGLGRIQEALSRYEHAVRLDPANREYRVNAGMAQLLEGDFRQGWQNYASRPAPAATGMRLWNGEHLKGSSILLLSEQGLGDTIQFIRYARLLGLEGGRVHAFCPPALAELLESAAGLECVVPDDQAPPSCDWYAPLLHLPAVFGTRIGTIPADIPYLKADPDRIRKWGAWIGAETSPSSHLRIGIAWRGGPDHWNDRNRSINPACLTALNRLPAVKFFSLQKGQPRGCEGLDFVPLPRDLGNFADTAALIMHLDLVISVDTSVAHLAGALGQPVWLLLPFAPDWRWMRGRDDSPWYPGMRLFRQPRRGEWLPVMEQIREALVSLTQTR
jgi:tetratricopeptide (TPR) repeat protein